MQDIIIEKVDRYFSAGYDALLKSGWERIKKELEELPKTPSNKQMDAIATVRKMCNVLPENKVWEFCSNLDRLAQQHH